MGMAEEVGKAAVGTVEAMKTAPLALALLVVNGLFLGLMAYVLGQVATNAGERNRSQMELIARLADDLRDCGGRVPKTNSLLRLYPPPPTLPIGIRD
jgi:hypothetical protein